MGWLWYVLHITSQSPPQSWAPLPTAESNQFLLCQFPSFPGVTSPRPHSALWVSLPAKSLAPKSLSQDLSGATKLRTRCGASRKGHVDIGQQTADVTQEFLKTYPTRKSQLSSFLDVVLSGRETREHLQNRICIQIASVFSAEPISSCGGWWVVNGGRQGGKREDSPFCSQGTRDDSPTAKADRFQMLP